MNLRTEALSVARPQTRARLLDYVELTKPRITLLVLVTTWVGFFVAAPALTNITLLFHTLLGSALVCSGCSALNQVWEVECDRRMKRTQNRPLPAGRLDGDDALAFGVTLAILGLAELAIFVNLLAASLTGLTLVIYLFVYTPLKRRTWIATTVGAIPGALPPMIGWAAARGNLDMGAWILFTIQFVWQLPHFYAIAWMYRDDYARGGFEMISKIDPDGRLTSSQITSWTTVLLPASLMLLVLGHAGRLYATAAILLGVAFLAAGLALVRRPSTQGAKRVFLLSIIYLPLLLGFLVFDILLGS